MPDRCQACFSAGARFLSIRRVTGNFPSFAAVLPAGQGRRELKVARQPLLDAIEHTRQFADSRKGAVKIQVRALLIETVGWTLK